MTTPVLYMLATPIGNLQDISLRAMEELRSATLIAAEDTRVARRLLAGLDIPVTAPIVSLRAHNERQAADTVIRALQEGGLVVYLTDAGTPGISDPGARLVSAVREAGFAASPLPGASALTALLAVAGMGEGAVHFYGFPPAATGQRQRLFGSLCALDGISVFYEAPHRITETIADLAAAFGESRRIVLGRELTKLHEQVVEGTLAEVATMLANGDIPIRGEFALAVENPATAVSAVDGWRVFCELSPLMPPRQAATIAAKVSGGKAGDIYKRHVEEGGRREETEEPPHTAPAQSSHFPDATVAAGATECEIHPFQFHGKTGEYFKIWIVNILLTIITLGAFSAWAKVRNHRYFYGNTTLNGANFEYIARPIKILIARAIVAVILLGGTIWAGEDLLRNASHSLLLIVLLPWALARGFSFNARYSLHRNVPFGFKRDGETYLAIYLIFLPLILWTLVGYYKALDLDAPLLMDTPLGAMAEYNREALFLLVFFLIGFFIVLSLPFLMRRFHRFKAENHRWGSMWAGFAPRDISSYVFSCWVIPVIIIFLLLFSVWYFNPSAFDESQTSPPAHTTVKTLALYLLFSVPLFAVMYAKLFRLYWESLVLEGKGRVLCQFNTVGFAMKIVTVNFFAKAISLGLLTPWAKIRRARYLATTMVLEMPIGAMDKVLAAAKEREGAIGEEFEAAEGLGFDFGLV